MIEDLANSLYASGGLPVIAMGIVAILLGVLESFFGYRLFKVQVAILAFLAGLGIGTSAFNAAFHTQWLSIVLAIALGILLGWLSMKIYKVGVFIVVGVLAFAAALAFVHNGWFALIVAIIVGALGVVLTKHVLIITTAIAGGSIAAGGVSTLIWGSPQAVPFWLQLLCVLVLGVLGAIVQYRSNRGEA